MQSKEKATPELHPQRLSWLAFNWVLFQCFVPNSIQNASTCHGFSDSYFAIYHSTEKTQCFSIAAKCHNINDRIYWTPQYLPSIFLLLNLAASLCFILKIWLLPIIVLLISIYDIKFKKKNNHKPFSKCSTEEAKSWMIPKGYYAKNLEFWC